LQKKTSTNYKNRPYERTKIGLCYRLYYDQRHSSKSRGHKEPQYSRDELASWIYMQPNFNILYQNWVNSNYTSDFRPSCDRLDNALGYSFGNIELVTWKENKLRANSDVKNNILRLNQTKVWKYLASGKFICNYDSIAEACRAEQALDQRNITACCQGKIPTAYGYRWSYEYLGESIEPLKINDSYDCEIFQYDALTKDIVNIYSSLSEVNENLFSHSKIRNVIQGLYETHEGFYWSKYYLSPDQINIDTTYVPRRIQQLSRTGEIIATFNSMSEASKVTGIGSGNISKCCSFKAKSAGGFMWRYEQNIEYLMQNI
jgi:hypothetical protein